MFMKIVFGPAVGVAALIALNLAVPCSAAPIAATSDIDPALLTPGMAEAARPRVVAQAYNTQEFSADAGAPPAAGEPVPERYEEEIAPSEQPGRRSASTVAAPNAGADGGALQRRINFPRDKGDDLDVLKLQIFLDYHGYSVGEIDGKWGYNTGRALYIYQKNNSMPLTGQLDDGMLRRLEGFGDAYLVYATLKPEDVSGPIGFVPRDYYEQSKMKFLPYESRREKLAEKFHCSQSLLQKLNPGVDLNGVGAGSQILGPNVVHGVDEKRGQVSTVRVSKHNKWAEAFDGQGRFMFYYPSTLGSENDPLPIGVYEVTGVNFNPTFNFQPKLFWDWDKTKPSALLPPGPNSPVGNVWIGTSRKSVGIHGTPNPENISRNTSHGCIRLTNWDAKQLATRVKPGTRLDFVE
jgi:peptidoglycan hydrolase-like protein with peptidoglycan-binding domain